MITSLRNITSLDNLGKKGQVATLLILMMVGVLIFILVTVNIGQNSIRATNLANAADAGALYLGSQLSTKANMLYESLGNNVEKCKRRGFLGIILAIIGAITGYLIGGPLGAVIGGAIGGSIGGAIVTQSPVGALTGAIQGAIIGAAIASGAKLGAKLGGKLAAEELTGTALKEALKDLSTEELAEMGSVTVLEGTGELAVVIPSTIGATIGAGAGATLAVGSTVYNEYVNDQMTAAAFAAAAEALSGLPEYDQYREGVFLQALSRTIDDPNKTQDIYDSDEDGDTEEMVPYFQYWWDRRAEELDGIIPELESLVEGFLSGPLSEFKEKALAFQEALSREEIEGTDGRIVELLRVVEYSEIYNFSFWQPGLSAEEWEEWVEECEEEECETCSEEPPAEYSELDYFIEELANLVEEIEAIQEQGTSGLTRTWHSWMGWFYDPEGDSDYYDTMETLIYGDEDEDLGGLNAWKEEIEIARDNLPECDHPWTGWGWGSAWSSYGSYNYNYVTNPPCICTCYNYNFYGSWASSYGEISTIDKSLIDEDEFVDVLSRIDDFIGDIEDFRQELASLYDDFQVLYAELDTDYGGINPVTYSWTDSRGEHSITVEVGPFKVPWVRKEKRGNWLVGKICLVLTDYHDDGTNTWVKITRRDPANKEMGILGRWNPTASAEEGFFTITRTSHAAYSYNYIKMSAK